MSTASRARAPQRTVGSILRGLLALGAIVVLLVGIPLALYAVAGNPLPGAVPSGDELLSALTQRDDGSLFIGILTWIAWIGWASFALGLLIEIPSALRGRKAPRLPALRFQQRTASGLVAAAAVLFTVSPVGVVATAGAAEAPTTTQDTGANVRTVDTPDAAPEQSATTTPEATTPAPQPAAQPVAEQAPAPPPTHVVTPGESLWKIAQDELGDGARWTEIAQLNYGVDQPGGYALDESHWIDPGWTLLLPADAASATLPETGTPAAETTHVVESGDTLWEIADDELGDGTRFPELVDASQDTIQPDGRQLTDPDVILPGWTITVPVAGEVTPEPPVVQPPVVQPPEEPPPVVEEPDPEPPPVVEEPPPVVEEPEVEQPEVNEPEVNEPEVNEPEVEQPEVSDPGVDGTQDEGADAGDEAFPVRTAAGVGALLAAGLLAYLAAKRRTQQRRRKPGQRIAMPTGAAAAVEQELRSVNDPMSVETVDLALRSLAAHCAERGVPLPPVRLARLTADQFELYLTEAAELPAPFVATAAGHVWLLPSSARAELDAAEVAQVTAPYPSLVTIGHGPEDGHLLLDLERIGTLALVGSPSQTRAVLAALAVELATSPWADDLQVTLVGACKELASGLDTGRVRYLPTVGSLLDELTTRARQDRSALAEDGVGSLDEARARGVAPAAWTPEIVLLAERLDIEQQDQLADLVEELPRVAVAAVTSGAEAVGEWSIDLDPDDDDLAVLNPVEVNVSPQRLDDNQYRQILELLGVADASETELWSGGSSEPNLADLPIRGDAPPNDEPPSDEPGDDDLPPGRGRPDDDFGPTGGGDFSPVTEAASFDDRLSDEDEEFFRAAAAADALPAQRQREAVEPEYAPHGMTHPEADADAEVEVDAEVHEVPVEAGPEVTSEPGVTVEPSPEAVPVPDTEPEPAIRAEVELSDEDRAALRAAAIGSTPDDVLDDEEAVRALAADADSHHLFHDADTEDELSLFRATAQGEEDAAAAEAVRRDTLRAEVAELEPAVDALDDVDVPAPLPPVPAPPVPAPPMAESPSTPPVPAPPVVAPVAAAPAPVPVSSAQSSAPGPIQPAPVVGDGPLILLLGPIEVEGADGPIEQSKYRQLTEIAAYIALHPGRGHAALDEAIWPGNPVTQNTRNTAISKLRRWFGRNDTGVDYLPRVDAGYRFNEAVSTDWQLWSAWVGDDPRQAPTERLTEALQLVRGQPFAGVNPRRYAWAEHLKQEMIAAIVDAAHELAMRGLSAGDAHVARKAATIGLQVEPGIELLWRDRLKAEHIAGNRSGIEDAVARLTAITDDLGGDMEDATIALIEELLPTPGRRATHTALPSYR